MLILIDDKVQSSTAPDKIKTGALADIYDSSNTVIIPFDASYQINCVGIGYTDATSITVSGAGLNETFAYDGKGLYELPLTTQSTITVTHNGTYIGRIASGFSRSLGVAPTREAGFYTTQTQRVTASGQQVDSAGGYNGRRIAMDFRYKIDRDIFTDIESAYSQIAKSLPWFIKFTTKEQVRLPWSRFYGFPNDNNLLLQSSVNRFLYSKQLDLYERF